MWDDALFALRRFLLELGNRLSSWRLSVGLMVLLATYHGLLAVWSTSSAPGVVRGIAGLAPFWILYALLVANTAFCFWRRLPQLRRELAAAPIHRAAAPDWERELGTVRDESEARAFLEAQGYRVVAAADGRVAGFKRRWAALGSYLFHGALILVALGFSLSWLGRAELQVRVAVGEEYSGAPGQVVSQSTPRPLAPAPLEPGFSVLDLRPEFWADQLLFTELSSELALEGGGSAVTRINRPVWLGGSAFLRLTGFGYAPRWELRDTHGHVLDTAFVKLAVFPPGQRDHFRLPGLPHRVHVEVLPDYVDEDGRPATRSLNLRRPAVIARVFRNRLDLGGAVLTADEFHEFEGLRLAFPEIRPWGEYAVVRDPGVPVLFAGYLLGLAGLALKLRGGRAEAECRLTDSGWTLRGWGGRPPAAAGSSG